MPSRSLAFLRSTASVVGVVALLAVLDPILAGGHLIGPYWYQVLLLMGINVTLAVSLNLINGFCGQFSLGHAGFMAAGGYAGAYFTLRLLHTPIEQLSPLQQGGWMIVALLLSALVASIGGFLVGIPSLRLRGDYLAIVTLGFGEIIRVLIINIDALGGASGLWDIPGLSRFFWIWLVAIGTIALSRNLFVSSHGRAVLAVREDEIAAESLGVPTTRVKVQIFALGSALAGMAGCLSAHLDMSLTPDSFGFMRSIEIIVMVILGGLGSTTGAALGAVLVTLLPEGLRFVPPFHLGSAIIQVQDWRMVTYSFLLIVLMLTRPKGILGGSEMSWHGLSRIGGKWRGSKLKNETESAEPEVQGDLL